MRRLRKNGVNIDEEGLKSPLLYAISPTLGNFMYQKNRILWPLWRALGILWAIVAVVVTLGIVIGIAGVLFGWWH